jgi:hypothetical protein
MAEKIFTEKDWDEIRMAFHTSIMVDTSLVSLAQNLDTDEWPFPTADETPAKYIDLSYAELSRTLALAGSSESLNHLITILRDTMAFDNPFGEMVQQTEVHREKDNQLLKNFAKVDIPESYPIGLTQLSTETIEFCQRENLTTLGQFAVFAQSMSKTVIVSGDFRKLLNALSHIDENALAELMPFRPASKGLHLPEALALPINVLAPAMRYALLRNFGAQLTREEADEADTLSEEDVTATAAVLRARADQFFAWFADELAELKAQIAEGGSIERYLMVLNDPVAETLVNVLLQTQIKPAPPAPEEKKAKKSAGFFGSLGRLFGKK